MATGATGRRPRISGDAYPGFRRKRGGSDRKLEALTDLHRRLRELRDNWQPMPHKPVSQTDMGAGGVDLFEGGS